MRGQKIGRGGRRKQRERERERQTEQRKDKRERELLKERDFILSWTSVTPRGLRAGGRRPCGFRAAPSWIRRSEDGNCLHLFVNETF